MPLLRKIFQPITQNFLMDPKVNERVFRAMEKVIRLCQHEKVQLKNSPPYLLEILPELYPLLRTAIKHVLDELSVYSVGLNKHLINGTHTTSSEMPFFLPSIYSELYEKHSIPDVLANAAVYLKLCLANVYFKCRHIIQLFKEDEQLVELSDPRSKSREKLSHASLLLSNMWKEFEAMFSVNVAEDKSTFIGLDFKITKQEGAQFWNQVFPKQCIVHWSHFVKEFTTSRSSFGIVDSEECRRLKATFDITENDYVSIFEFDIFVRLFHPFRNLIQNWCQITQHPAYMGFKTYDEICSILSHHSDRPGSYVFRVSCTKLGQWSIGYVDSHGKILQTIPSTPTLIEALNRGVEDRYYLYPNGDDFNPHLKTEVDEVERLVVSEEDQEIYHMINSTYEECKLCYERQKDTRIEPCNHLICKPCLEQIRKQPKAECPWCRQEIRGNVNITIEPTNVSKDNVGGIVTDEQKGSSTTTPNSDDASSSALSSTNPFSDIASSSGTSSQESKTPSPTEESSSTLVGSTSKARAASNDPTTSALLSFPDDGNGSATVTITSADTTTASLRPLPQKPPNRRGSKASGGTSSSKQRRRTTGFGDCNGSNDQNHRRFLMNPNENQNHAAEMSSDQLNTGGTFSVVHSTRPTSAIFHQNDQSSLVDTTSPDVDAAERGDSVATIQSRSVGVRSPIDLSDAVRALSIDYNSSVLSESSPAVNNNNNLSGQPRSAAMRHLAVDNPTYLSLS